jgi:hypothetical protein
VIERELRRRLRSDSRSLDELMTCVQRIDLEPQAVRITFIRAKTPRTAIADAEIDFQNSALAVVILPIRCRSRGGRTWISGPAGSDGTVRVRRDPTLIKGLQQAHRILARHGWRPDGAIENGRALVAPANPHERKLCRLALLAPDIQKRILEGRQPWGLTLDQLLNGRIPTAWPAQREAFGFSEAS